jgi:ribosome-binding factor A
MKLSRSPWLQVNKASISREANHGNVRSTHDHDLLTQGSRTFAVRWVSDLANRIAGVLMRSRKISRRSILAASSDVGPGDGLDPRFDRPDEPPKVKNRKALQLCGQVAETLALVLGDSGDAVLQNLLVQSVVPWPTSARVLVTVTPAIADGFDEEPVAAHLDAAQTRLRSEVAASIHRRKVPDLLFRILPPS